MLLSMPYLLLDDCVSYDVNHVIASCKYSCLDRVKFIITTAAIIL